MRLEYMYIGPEIFDAPSLRHLHREIPREPRLILREVHIERVIGTHHIVPVLGEDLHERDGCFRGLIEAPAP